MTSLVSTADSPFDENQVSSSVSPSDSPQFFREHGIFYMEDAEIGRQVAELEGKGLAWSPQGLSHFMPTLLKDPRVAGILEPFHAQTPCLCYSLGSSYPGHYFASTIDENQEQRILVYMWSAGTHLEFADGSHIPPSKGVKSANGMYEVPYKFLKKKGLREIKVRMEEGGVMIVHPRLAFQSTQGFSMAYGLQEADKGSGNEPK